MKRKPHCGVCGLGISRQKATKSGEASVGAVGRQWPERMLNGDDGMLNSMKENKHKKESKHICRCKEAKRAGEIRHGWHSWPRGSHRFDYIMVDDRDRVGLKDPAFKES